MNTIRKIIPVLIFLCVLLIGLALFFQPQANSKEPESGRIALDPHWVEVNPAAEWPGRLWHCSVATPDDEIVLMGGQVYDTGVMNDVWKSRDYGVSWTRLPDAAPWSRRAGHSCVALPDGSIVLMGGHGPGFKNDVWRSTDSGNTWVQMTPDAGWSPREFQSSVVLADGSILVIGGISEVLHGAVNDVWRSEDEGATWTRMTAKAEWTPRNYQTAAVLPDGSVILSGGYEWELGRDVVFHSDTWRSTDNGTSWHQMSASAGWTDRGGQALAARKDGSLILAGGKKHARINGTYAVEGINPNDTWMSTDSGATWTLMNESGGWQGRTFPALIALPGGSVMLMGGEANKTLANDVWVLSQSGSPTFMKRSAPWP